MDIYFSPLACSLASRIALYEAGAEARFVEVDPFTHRILENDTELSRVAPLGLVPALRTDEGDLLTENAAVLQWIASAHPAARLAPDAPLERARLQEWLSFIGTELHKLVFAPFFDRSAPADAKRHALSKAPARLARLEQHLAGREHLLDRFSVADAYLVTVLNWAQATPISLATYPAVAAYLERGRARPSVRKALAIEVPLYQAEQKRHAA